MFPGRGAQPEQQSANKAGPQLSLSYDSGSGNAPFGFGWSLSLPSITRKTDKSIPRYYDAIESDVFILSGAEDLVPEYVRGAAKWKMVDGKYVILEEPHVVVGETFTVQHYRPRIEGLFARIERWINEKDHGDVCWRSFLFWNPNLIQRIDVLQQSQMMAAGKPPAVFSPIFMLSQLHWSIS